MRLEEVDTVKKLKKIMLALSLILVTGSVASAKSFDTDSVRGRYTGHVELGANFSDGTSTQRLDIQMLAALTFNGESSVTGTASVTASIPGQPAPFTCPFAVTGTYEIGAEGLGGGTLVLVASDPACGEEAGATLQVSVVVGGHNRRRLDVKVNGAVDGTGQALPLVGTGTLEK